MKMRVVPVPFAAARWLRVDARGHGGAEARAAGAIEGAHRPRRHLRWARRLRRVAGRRREIGAERHDDPERAPVAERRVRPAGRAAGAGARGAARLGDDGGRRPRADGGGGAAHPPLRRRRRAAGPLDAAAQCGAGDGRRPAPAADARRVGARRPAGGRHG